MSNSQAFRARIVKQIGISAETGFDKWGARKLSDVQFDEQVALRIAPLALMDTSDVRGYRQPRSRAERLLNELYRGVMVTLDIDTIETKSISYFGAIDYGAHKIRSRLTLDVQAHGRIPEFEDQKVFVQATNLMLHRSSPAELEGGLFIHQARIIPYDNPATV